MAITHAKIFPPIGIARLGDSPDGFFIGPEIPGVRPAPPGGYKDAKCRVKRQAARFRLFGYDGATLVGEITAAAADITWTVHLANTKASWRRFAGQSASASFRNAAVTDRSTLEIDPGAATLTGPGQAAGFNTGRFRGRYVPLGEMRTEATTGRLLVLGGFGRSGSVPDGAPITHYANNDDWYDDVSDGPVTATVTLSGASIPVDPAWVLCTPPDFAPPIDSLTTLYDALFQVAVDNGWLSIPASPSLVQDVLPILSRVFALQRVNPEAASGHFDFDPGAVAAMSASRRQAIFNRLRNPANPGAGGGANMPKLYGDTGTSADETVTPAQYSILERWKDGTFTNDWTGSLPPPASSVTAEGLTRAALEACVGGAFFPGIEASWFLEKTYPYSEPFRLDHTGRSPGDVSKQMAVPWQADFYKCYNYGGVGWWPAQRPDDVFPESGGGPVDWIRNIIFSHEDMIAHWSKLGFVVDKAGALVETERQVVCKSLVLVTDKSHFSRDEVDGALTGGSPARFSAALYVIAEGFTPGELGVTTATPTEAQLAGFAPQVSITRSGGTPVPAMTAVAEALLLQDASLPAALRQRFTFVYRVEFANADGFSVSGTPTDQTLTVTASKAGQSSTGTLLLFHQPNPYMLDGPTSWLSTDVRVFKIEAGQSRFGQTLGNDAAAARAFITAVVGQFNTLGPAGHPFETLATDPQASRLELSEKVGSTPVFNFAVARVRYRGNLVSAPDVRVFFRLFTTAATGLDYDENATYRRTLAGTPVPLLGLQAGKLVTIPCFAAQRVDTASASLASQTDPLNVRTLAPAGADEQHAYFGCWLDFNQTAPQFPIQPSPANGSWSSGRKSIQELIRGLHQCLVAEVYFPGDPIPAGVTPAAHDNLAQRNLVIAESDNPGSAATHTVAHTFEIRASRPLPQVMVVGTTAEPVAGAAVLASFDPQAATTGVRMIDPGPDELMIRWHDLPRETKMTLYFPDLDAGEIMRRAGQRYDVPRLEQVDDHTVRCLASDVSFVPLPHRLRRNLPALLTLELPEGIKRGQAFRATVHQLSGLPRRILGAFELAVPVSDKGALRAGEERALSVLRHVSRAIPLDDPWSPVFDRYLGLVAERVRGFGGDPESIGPAPDGSGVDGGLSGAPDPAAARRCARLGGIVTALLMLLVILAGVNPLPHLAAEAVLAALTADTAFAWARRCRPRCCRWLLAVLTGLALGAGVVGLAALAGLAGPRGPVVLSLAGLGVGLATLAGLGWRCLRLGDPGS